MTNREPWRVSTKNGLDSTHSILTQECADLVVAEFGARFNRYSVSLKGTPKFW